MKKNKVRINISVDKDKLIKAKQKLHLFGGKLSTLFNAYLDDFILSIDKELGKDYKNIEEKIKEIEERISKLENG